ncbi:MAG: hypothetical protein GWN01_08670 [Nitrosopumilaceae archaeon]|nr:hypothetical protein [Nitrosopumilaceae archaeon]NIU87431.1 hypothetical protein [Nitrosopumilaceae archaeon]NIX61589.1 hypothetical protein [Nitrosopumilaceae archaeon]
MNIFCTHPDPVNSAMDHCAVHCRKMIVEVAQMLSTCHRILDGDNVADERGLYKTTHQNHPSSKWIRGGYDNYVWAYEHFKALGELYEVSTGKVHKTIYKLQDALQCPPVNISSTKLTLPTPAVPHKYMRFKNVPSIYKNYLNDKFLEWTTRDKPVKLHWYLGKPDWVFKV